MIVDAKPYEYTFDPEKTALLVIDMQRDFCEHEIGRASCRERV